MLHRSVEGHLALILKLFLPVVNEGVFDVAGGGMNRKEVWLRSGTRVDYRGPGAVPGQVEALLLLKRVVKESVNRAGRG